MQENKVTEESTKIIPVSPDVDKIIKSLPVATMEQKVYKAKVIFLGIDKRAANYNPTKVWSANGNVYSVVDGKVAYLPEEAKNSLLDAVEIRKVPTPVQERFGIDGARAEKYKTELVPRFDIQVLEVYKQAIVNGNKVFVSETEEIKAKDRDETIKTIIAEKEKIMRAELEEEFKTKLEHKIELLNSNLTPIMSEDDLISLKTEIESIRNDA